MSRATVNMLFFEVSMYAPVASMRVLISEIGQRTAVAIARAKPPAPRHRLWPAANAQKEQVAGIERRTCECGPGDREGARAVRGLRLKVRPKYVEEVKVRPGAEREARHRG